MAELAPVPAKAGYSTKSLYSLNQTLYIPWALLHLGIFLCLGYLQQRGMFAAGFQDGFYHQITDITDDSALRPIHLLRVLIVAPFLWFENHAWHEVWQCFILALYSLPVLFARFKGKYAYAQVLILYLPFVFSFRSILGMLSIAFLFMYFFGTRRWYQLSASALLANLSSGIVLAWLGIVGILLLRRRKINSLNIVLTVLMTMSLSASLYSKYFFFKEIEASSRAAAYIEHDPDDSVLDKAIARNTVINSYREGNFKKFLGYILILGGTILAVIYMVKRRQVYTEKLIFFSFILPSFAFEGLGPSSFLIALLWLFLYYFLDGTKVENAV